jgi:lysyl-tRNA synthetase class 2
LSGPRGREAPHPEPGNETLTPPSLPWKVKLHTRDCLIRSLRSFFQRRGYIEVETPVRVLSPGIDPYIDALPAGEQFFLATSPELEMKKLLAAGMDRIFQVTRAFRADEEGDLHSPEFSLLEWYSVGENYADLMETTEELVREAGAALEDAGIFSAASGWPSPFPRVTVDEIFRRHAGWEPSRAFETDPFFRDLVEKVEPELAAENAIYLTDYPARAGALARRKPEDPKVCERFELYLEGIEICNGFTELTDPVEQVERFERDNTERRRLGKSTYPIDGKFVSALESGLPPCAGNALGIDRLLLALTGSRRLSSVTLLASSSPAPSEIPKHGDPRLTAALRRP